MTKLSESALEEFVEFVEPTGSRVICNPPPMDTDEDFLVKLKPNISLKFFEQQMQFEGFEGSSGDMYDLDEAIFVSLRKEEANLIVTTDQEFFDKMVLATAVAKRLNVMKKSDRIMLCNAIVRGEHPNAYKHGLFGKPMASTTQYWNNEFSAPSLFEESVATQPPAAPDTVQWNPINTGHVIPPGTTAIFSTAQGLQTVTNNGTNPIYVNEIQPV